MLGEIVCGYKLITIQELANETNQKGGIISRLPWLRNADVQNDLNAAIINFTEKENEEYDDDAEAYLLAADSFLEIYCANNNINQVRYMSFSDAKALAIALHQGYILATDEWPLREFSKIIEPDSNGDRLQLLTSLDLLQLLEQGGKIDADNRRKTVRDWILNEESLIRSWEIDYWRLFNEAPPRV